MVSSISQGSGGSMFDLIGMAQNNMSLLQSQRESRRANAGGIVCETTADPKYMLGALASRQSICLLADITEKATLAATEAALEENKKYIEEKAQEALAPHAEDTLTHQMLEEKARDEETQPETTSADRDVETACEGIVPVSVRGKAASSPFTASAEERLSYTRISI